MKFLQKAILVAFVLLPTALLAQAKFVEGIHYKRLNTTAASTNSGDVEVTEFFGYGCPHCYHLESTLSEWIKAKPGYVKFQRVPVVFRPAWQQHAKAFYTAKALGILEQFHGDMFHAIHEENQPPVSDEALGSFFKRYEVDGETFQKVFGSFGVETQVKQALVKARNAQITSVPTLVVNDKFYTNGVLAGSPEKIVEVIDYLAKLERGADSTQ